MTARLWLRNSILVTCLALASGCATTPPAPLDESEHWQDVMREGHIPSRATVFLSPPRFERQADLELAEAAPVSIDADKRSSYWPAALPEQFEEELRQIMRENTGYEITLWNQSAENGPNSPSACDYELRLTVTTYRLELLEVGMGSAMASLWLMALPHLATYYNAPDEIFRCEYQMSAALHDPKTGEKLCARTMRASKVLALTDFQRGWTLYSYWPEQSLRWLPETDAVTAWITYADSVTEACEPHARRELLIELVRFLREVPPPDLLREKNAPFALVVGVDRPREAGAEVGSAEQDAQAFTDWLRAGSPRPGAILESQLDPDVGLLLGARATGDEVQRQLWKRVGRIRAGDRLILYFAGAGTLQGDSGTEPALLFADRACPVSSLLEPLRAARRRGGTAIAIFDAGFFGGSRCQGQPAASAGDVVRALQRQLDGVFLWLSAGQGAAGALEAPDLGRGLFTSSLLEGLAGSADADGAGGVTLEELAGYVSEVLPSRSRSAQQALLLGPEDRSVVVVPSPPPEGEED